MPILSPTFKLEAIPPKPSPAEGHKLYLSHGSTQGEEKGVQILQGYRTMTQWTSGYLPCLSSQNPRFPPQRPMPGSLVGILYIPFVAVCGWWETVSDSERIMPTSVPSGSQLSAAQSSRKKGTPLAGRWEEKGGGSNPPSGVNPIL